MLIITNAHCVVLCLVPRTRQASTLRKSIFTPSCNYVVAFVFFIYQRGQWENPFYRGPSPEIICFVYPASFYTAISFL
ncbi:hypothetical protein BX661DRAFT_188389, partial [Kickxella alabastrina]|uniref:uncharacterized protein n=1 Tax=Kickxella alabastrina TaxID=61397 RepID=UPI00221EAC6C